MFKWKKRYRRIEMLFSTSLAHISYVMTENKFLRKKLEKLGVKEIFDDHEKTLLEAIGKRFFELSDYFEATVGKTIDEALSQSKDD